MDTSNVTKNVREVAACQSDHTIDVLTAPQLNGQPVFDDNRYPAVIRHEAPSEKGPIASLIPIEQNSWGSIVDGDSDAPDIIKEKIDLAHHAYDAALTRDLFGGTE